MGHAHRGCVSFGFTIAQVLCLGSCTIVVSLSFVSISTICSFCRGNMRKPIVSSSVSEVTPVEDLSLVHTRRKSGGFSPRVCE